MKYNSTTPEDIVALSLVRGAGRKALHAALRFSARNARPLSAFFGTPLPELIALAAPGETNAADVLSRCGEEERKRAGWQMALARENGFRHVTSMSHEYPAFVRYHLRDQAPPILFYRGNEALLDAPGAGIVGTRRASGEGLEYAAEAARSFAREGIAVVSGAAGGIDQAAHKAALLAGGNTLAILPEGLQAFDPPAFLRAGLEHGQVLLLSEFLPTDGWQTHRAMTRNRTIAACSSLICVIEPREKGGSMFTAEQALTQGKTVFYWGGACRDGALGGRKGANPLTDARGRIRARALRHAAQQEETHPPDQIGLFD